MNSRECNLLFCDALEYIRNAINGSSNGAQVAYKILEAVAMLSKGMALQIGLSNLETCMYVTRRN